MSIPRKGHDDDMMCLLGPNEELWVVMINGPGIGFNIAPKGDWSKQFQTIELSYIYPYGGIWKATIVGKPLQFHHVPISGAGNGKTHNENALTYVAWNGEYWTASIIEWDLKSVQKMYRFHHEPVQVETKARVVPADAHCITNPLIR